MEPWSTEASVRVLEPPPPDSPALVPPLHAARSAVAVTAASRTAGVRVFMMSPSRKRPRPWASGGCRVSSPQPSREAVDDAALQQEVDEQDGQNADHQRGEDEV